MTSTIPVPIPSERVARARLLQLVSAGLPVGAFTYSQGLEWAAEQGWVNTKAELKDWLSNQLATSLAALESPLFLRMADALLVNDTLAFVNWTEYLMASRETAELRAEEAQRGRALGRLLPDLGLALPADLAEAVNQSQLAGFAFATNRWRITPDDALHAWLFAWIENSVLAGVKLIPLGQTHGQQLIFSLSEEIDAAIETAHAVTDDVIGYSCFAQVIASSKHETQYTRLYRS